MFPALRPLLSQTLTATVLGALLLVPVAAFVLSGDRADRAQGRLAALESCDFASKGCRSETHWRESRFPRR